MMMKQTQTKMFDFSDVGLDFCAGSKNLFPDRLKKIVCYGYNEQTVTSVSITTNSVTLNYSVPHNYAENRVIKINSGPLSSINGGEFFIDSLNDNSLTFSLSNPPAILASSSGFKTCVAPLGWEIAYEQANIHVYKLKALDETDLYLRICFQSVASNRNSISPCLGVSFDQETGFITDPYALQANRGVMSSLTGFRWEISGNNTSAHNDWTYAQGAPVFYGKGIVIGSKYHLLIATHGGAYAGQPRLNGLLPSQNMKSDILQKACLLGDKNSSGSSSSIDNGASTTTIWQCGNYEAVNRSINSANSVMDVPSAPTSYLPNELLGFNSTTAEPLPLYLKSTNQHIGYVYGLYRCKYAANFSLPNARLTLPKLVPDYETNPLFMHAILLAGSSSDTFTGANCIFYVSPLEEIKIEHRG